MQILLCNFYLIFHELDQLLYKKRPLQQDGTMQRPV